MTTTPPTTEIPVARPIVKEPAPVVREESTPIYDALREELGHDPLNRQHSSYDEYYTASQLYAEAKAGLEKLCTLTVR